VVGWDGETNRIKGEKMTVQEKARDRLKMLNWAEHEIVRNPYRNGVICEHKKGRRLEIHEQRRWLGRFYRDYLKGRR